MPGGGYRNLEPPIVPLDLALEVPAFRNVNGYRRHTALLGVDDCALDQAFSEDIQFRAFGCKGRFSLGGRSRNARPRSGARRWSRGAGRTSRAIRSGSGRNTGGAGCRTTAWVHSQTGGLFAAIGQRVLMLLQTGHDSASTRLHSRAQFLCILCAGVANRSKLILRQRRLRRSGADNDQ